LLRRLPFSTDAYAIGLITYKVRSENGYGFLRPGLKTGGGNDIFWSEIGSGFGDAGGTTPPKIPRGTPPPGANVSATFFVLDSLRILRSLFKSFHSSNSERLYLFCLLLHFLY